MNGPYYKPQGNTLVIVLLFSLLIAAILLTAAQLSHLELKMSQNALGDLRRSSHIAQQLKAQELTLEEQWTIPAPQLLQFVPDTLHFQERNGVNYYTINMATFRITYAQRQPAHYEQPSKKVRLKAADHTWFEAYVVYDDPDAWLVITDPQSQVILQELKLPIREGRFENTPLVTDLNSSGITDCLFLTDLKGALWKFHVNADFPRHIPYQYFSQHCWAGAPIEQMMMGRGVKANEYLIYLLLNHGPYKTIVAVSDQIHAAQGACLPVVFKIDNLQLNSKMRLWHRLLITNSEQHIYIFDALTGKLKQQVAIQKKVTGTVVGDQPEIMTRRPREAKRMVRVALSDGVGESEVELDYERLGRRTWRRVGN